MRGLLRAAVAELADAQDLGSCIFPMYGFKSHRPYILLHQRKQSPVLQMLIESEGKRGWLFLWRWL